MSGGRAKNSNLAAFLPAFEKRAKKPRECAKTTLPNKLPTYAIFARQTQFFAKITAILPVFPTSQAAY